MIMRWSLWALALPLAACSTGSLGDGELDAASVADSTTDSGGPDSAAIDSVAIDSSTIDSAPAVDATVETGVLSCKSGVEPFTFTVTMANQFKRIPLPLEPGVEYRRVTLSFDFTATKWSGTCNNPATSAVSGFPIFESLVALKRSDHWCKGGNLFELTLHGPASGHGASNKAGAETYYKAKAHTGSGCGMSDVEAKVFNANHGLSEGAKHKATVVYDATLGKMSANLGPTSLSGPMAAGAKLIANGSESWNVVFSFDGGFFECYDAKGVEDPTAPCCWGPSVGWVYENLSWEICR